MMSQLVSGGSLSATDEMTESWSAALRTDESWGDDLRMLAPILPSLNVESILSTGAASTVATGVVKQLVTNGDIVDVLWEIVEEIARVLPHAHALYGNSVAVLMQSLAEGRNKGILQMDQLRDGAYGGDRVSKADQGRLFQTITEKSPFGPTQLGALASLF